MHPCAFPFLGTEPLLRVHLFLLRVINVIKGSFIMGSAVIKGYLITEQRNRTLIEGSFIFQVLYFSGNQGGQQKNLIR